MIFVILSTKILYYIILLILKMHVTIQTYQNKYNTRQIFLFAHESY